MFLILILAGVIGFVASGGWFESKSSATKSFEPSLQPSVTGNVKNSIFQESVFVPYWSLEHFEPENNKVYFYFGVTGDTNGINTLEAGYKNMEEYFSLLPNDSKRIVVVRMTDSSLNSQILKDPSSQQKIIEDSLKLSRAYRLDGILFDFEMSSISFDVVTNRVTAFYKTFYEASRNENLAFYTTMYGDTLYRVRPYDLEKLSQYTDQVFIMAYDFHKARGNPGPNFPLEGREVYGYDFKQMTDDFLQSFPSEKLSIIFGMFGYDWKVDPQRKSVEQARSLSFFQINQKFSECIPPDCQKGSDQKSGESWVKYKDSEGSSHEVWYESLESVKMKQEFLRQKGINNFSYWAYSYY